MLKVGHSFGAEATSAYEHMSFSEATLLGSSKGIGYDCTWYQTEKHQYIAISLSSALMSNQTTELGSHESADMVAGLRYTVNATQRRTERKNRHIRQQKRVESGTISAARL